MEVKRTEMEIFKTKQTYYDDLNQHSSDNFWKLLIALCVVLIVIIVFITCYHYIHGKIIYICKRCFTWRNTRNNIDDNFFVIKSDNSCTKRRFFWPKGCKVPKSRMKFNDQKDRLYETKSYAFRTPIQEKKKLLDYNEDKTIIPDSNIHLTKRLFLKLSALSSRTDKKIARNQTLNNRNACNELCTQRIEKFHQHSHKNEKNICFSDTDLKFLRIPVSLKKSKENRNKKILCKWNLKNTNNYNIRHDTSSKLIELRCENRDSFSNSNIKYGVYSSKSNNFACSFVSKNIATDFISDFAVNKSANSALKQRSTNSYTGSMVSDVSNATDIKSEENRLMYATDETTTSEIDKLQRTELDERKAQTKMRKLKSSMDILKSQTKEINSKRKVKSEDDLTVLSIKTENIKNYSMLKNFISMREKHIESPLTSLNHNSETNEIYDELGILFSQYMKLQIKPCNRKYCIRSRHLKRIQHSMRKCHVRFNYREIYPHDRRPACNCGNICEDTYDELKLMSILPLERKNIYHQMVTRRKQFLNQPCILINQEFRSN